MFKNQYCILPHTVTPPLQEFNTTHIGDLVIHSHSALPVYISKTKNRYPTIALIGYILNPLAPADGNEKIIDNLAQSCETVTLFFQKIQIFTGRYVLLYHNAQNTTVIGDACHLRQIYYGTIKQTFLMTSSIKLALHIFNESLQIHAEKMLDIESTSFVNNESAWFGDDSFDDRLKKLLPNHYYDVTNNIIGRIPVYPLRTLTAAKSIQAYIIAMLTGTYDALIQRYTLIHPLTAGLDSRLLLAASKKHYKRIQYYVFDYSQGKGADAWVPLKLTRKLGIPFRLHVLKPLHADFVRNFEAEHIFPRILPKTEEIQYHYDQHYAKHVINVNGNPIHIAKCNYGVARSGTTAEQLRKMSGCSRENIYLCKKIDEWVLSAASYARQNNISLRDLFFWENRVGNWGALLPFEQDIAVEEMSPFNNRNLLLAMLQIPPNKRQKPHYIFFKKLIKYLWPQLLSFPINPEPIVHRLKKSIKQHVRNGILFYYYAFCALIREQSGIKKYLHRRYGLNRFAQRINALLNK